METKAKKGAKAAKWDRQVSRKFYESICDQIRSAGRLSDDIDVEHLIRVFDEYVTKRNVSDEFSETENVVFTLLQPIIDKAMWRSDRARMAAKRRREAKEAAKQAEAEETQTDDMAVDVVAVDVEAEQPASDEKAPEVSPIEPPKSREELRRERQTLRREAAAARRLEKHRKRIARRQQCNKSPFNISYQMDSKISS